jgi:hypothetical protein
MAPVSPFIKFGSTIFRAVDAIAQRSQLRK